jgi:hypothetical protein
MDKKEIKSVHVTLRVTPTQSLKIIQLAKEMKLNKSQAIIKTLLNE